MSTVYGHLKFVRKRPELNMIVTNLTQLHTTLTASWNNHDEDDDEDDDEREKLFIVC